MIVELMLILFRLQALVFRSNPVVIILVVVVFFLYAVVALVGRHLDSLDRKRVSVVPLCGVDGEHKYEVMVVTGRRKGAGTTSHVAIDVEGSSNRSGERLLELEGAFQRGATDTFCIATQHPLGQVRRLRVWHDNSGVAASWYLSRVVVRCLETNEVVYFLAKRWLSLEKADDKVEVTLEAADETEKKKFKNILAEEASRGVADRHLWLSIFERPAHSRFTRVQRASVCAANLYAYMFVCALWYALMYAPPPFDSTDPLASDVYAQEVTWTDVTLGVVVALIIFPLTTLLSVFFKHIGPKTGLVYPRPQSAQSIEIMADPELLSDCGSSTAGNGAPAVYGGIRRGNGGVLRIPSLLSSSGSSGDSSLPPAAGPLKRSTVSHGRDRAMTFKSFSSYDESVQDSTPGVSINSLQYMYTCNLQQLREFFNCLCLE